MAKVPIQTTFNIGGTDVVGYLEGWAISGKDDPIVHEVAFMGPNGEIVGGYDIFESNSSSTFFGREIEEGLVKALWAEAMSEAVLAELEWQFHREQAIEAPAKMRMIN